VAAYESERDEGLREDTRRTARTREGKKDTEEKESIERVRRNEPQIAAVHADR